MGWPIFEPDKGYFKDIFQLNTFNYHNFKTILMSVKQIKVCKVFKGRPN